MRGMAGRAPLDVFRYADYRAFLRAFYEHRKGQRRGISLRAFSRKVGLRSPNYLKLVMDGDRNLTGELALRFAEACGLNGESVEYFCALVAFNQAKSQKERELHQARLRGFRRYRETHKLDLAQDAYHSRWYIPAIRELAARSDFRAEPKWIAKTLLPPISESQAKKALSVLHELGLLVEGEDGRPRQAEPLVETRAGPLGHHVVSFHREMMRLASEALERVPRDEREIASLTLCISQRQMVELKAELERIEDLLLQRYPSDDAERVVQVNVQMFPLSLGKD
jgi:uncharacterized protein (TIGR02147 family)